MDLNDLSSVEEAQPLTLIHPSTGVELMHEGKPCVLNIIGPETPKMRALDRKVQQKRIKSAGRTGRVNLTVEEIEAETIERLATAIAGWENIFQGGKAVKYSHEEAVRLMTDYAWMRDQVDQFYRDVGNFLKGREAKAS